VSSFRNTHPGSCTCDLCEEARYITEAQFALDHHPARSPFWDSRAGQQALQTAEVHALQTTTTESFRRGWHLARMKSAHIEAEASGATNENPDGCYYCGRDHHSNDCMDEVALADAGEL
jgi:hypothetical protein